MRADFRSSNESLSILDSNVNEQVDSFSLFFSFSVVIANGVLLSRRSNITDVNTWTSLRFYFISVAAIYKFTMQYNE